MPDYDALIDEQVNRFASTDSGLIEESAQNKIRVLRQLRDEEATS